ncbi:MAG: hypothetical protein E7582_07225 [Ruminococcaceae bacterium]|nr:hypothetical protein [Oscillospiraceae bacterium]
MKSGALKFFIIGILLIINLYFVFTLNSLKNAKTYFDTEEIKEAVEVLNKKGVKIDAKKVITKKEVPDVLKTDFVQSSIENVAKKVMQEDFGSFAIPDGQRFANEKESLSFYYDYSFEYVLPHYEFDVNRIKGKLNFSYAYGEETEEKYNSAFDNLFDNFNSGDYKIHLKIRRIFQEENMTYIEAVECIDSYEINGAHVYAALDGEKVVFASGKLYFFQSTSGYKSDAMDSINILFELDKKEEEITKMELVYLPVPDHNNSFYFVPTYKFTYSNSDVELFDATSGTKR